MEEDRTKAKEQWNKFPLEVSTIDEIKAQIKKNGENFVDVHFLPDDSAVFRQKNGEAFDRIIHWRRPRDFMLVDPRKGQLEPQVFEKMIEPSDIIQGELADCWFLCACSSLAEMPELVERLFVTPTYNEEGLYRVRICKDGEWREVTLDDYFPCFPLGGPIFSRANNNELWVLLLEKAYAKLHGNFKALVGGSPHQALMDLTGCPTASFKMASDMTQKMLKEGKLWRMLLQWDQQGYLISGGTPGESLWQESENRPDGSGLVPGHAYSIIQVIEA